MFLLAFVLTFFWGISGHHLARDAVASGPEEMTQKIIRDLGKENPQAAAELTRIRENSDIRALSAVLYEADKRGGMAEVQHMVDRKVQHGKMPSEIRLASLAVDPNLLPDAKNRDEFLWAHGSALQLLDQDGTGKASNAYLDCLERASRTPDSWRVAKADSMAMLVYECVSTPVVREYYAQEQEWLDAIIVEVTASAAMDDTAKRALVSGVVEVAYDNRPYFKQAVEQKFDSSAFCLFSQHGDIIRQMVGLGGVPLEEALEVIFANGDFLERKKDDTPYKLAATLMNIHSEKPAVWQAARKIGLALRLHEDAPDVANQLFEKYPADDIAALLYAGYENEVVFAAAAVVKFGDLAIYILNKFEGSRKFHEALKRNVGPRLIPYVAKFGDKGVERLEEDQGWLDKYFLKDGTPKEKEWWTQIPGGGMADVARNWAKGFPNEWSELGWAALDVADAALAVATFGGSEVVTETVKESGEVVVKNLAKAEAKREILRAGQRRATKNGARKAAQNESQSLLRRAINEGAKFGRVVTRLPGKAWRITVAVGRTARVAAEKVLIAAKKFHGTWVAVPVAYRKFVYRSLLAVGLFVTISERTIPALGKIGAAAGKFVDDAIKDIGQAVRQGLKEGFDMVLGGKGGKANRWLSWIIYLVVLGGLVIVSWKLCPIGKGRLRYV